MPSSPTIRKKHWRMRQVGEKMLAASLRGICRALCYTYLPVNHFYGYCIGRGLWFFNTEAKRVSQANLAVAFPNLSDDEQQSLAKNSLCELGKTITELGPVWCGSRNRLNRLVKKVSGEEVCQKAREDGRGVIILAPHFGAWELVGLYLSLHYKIVSLYRPPRLAPIEQFTRDVRERFGAELVPTDVSGVRALCRSLKQSNMIGVLPDQDPGESGGVYAPFFGHDARTMVLVSRLAAKSNSVVVYCVAERLGKGRGYHIHFVEADPAVGSKDQVEAATAMNRGIEKIVQINPAQYQWSYKRYRAAVAGKLNPYQQPVPQKRAA